MEVQDKAIFDTNTILANPFISTPMTFGVSNVDSTLRVYSTLYDEAPSPELTTVAGSLVVNPNVVGAAGQVIPMLGRCHGQSSQRLWIQASSPSAPYQRRSVDFFPLVGSTYDNPAAMANGANLGMRISDDLLAPSSDAAESSGYTIPLIVGPESAVIAGEIKSGSPVEDISIPWGSIWNIAKTVLPVVAKAGYEIFQEVRKSNADEEAPDVEDLDDVELFLAGIFGSIAKLAVPMLGKLLGGM